MIAIQQIQKIADTGFPEMQLPSAELLYYDLVEIAVWSRARASRSELPKTQSSVDMTLESVVALIHNRQMRFRDTQVKFNPPCYSGPSDIIQAANTAHLRTPIRSTALTTPAADVHAVSSIAHLEPLARLCVQ